MKFPQSYCSHCNLITPTLDGYYYNKCSKCYNPIKKETFFGIKVTAIFLFILTLLLLLLLQSVSAYVVTANVSLTQSIGVIRSDFYGVNEIAYLSNASNRYSIDTNNDGTLDTISNVTWHRQMFLDSGMKGGRIDATLQSRYSNQTARTDGVNFTADFNRTIEAVRFAYENNITVTVVLSYMPSWLGDNSSGKCKSYNYCPPSNYTIWNNIVKHAVKNITNNGQFTNVVFDVWNEPDYGSFWMGNLANDDINRYYNYSVLYNNTYWAIKSVYPNMKVGGYSATDIINYPVFFNNFLSNYSNQFDFFGLHIYGDNIDFLIQNYTSYLKNKCTFYNANCSWISWEEWNSNNVTVLNGTSNNLGSKISSSYSNMLNDLPSNITSLLFKWSSIYVNISYEDFYRKEFALVSEPMLNNKTNPSYNITQLYSRSHKGGNTVMFSNTSDSQLKIVVSKDSTKTYITLTNVNSTATNVTLNIPLTNSYLKDVSTNTIYPIENGVATINNLEGYGVQTLESNPIVLKAALDDNGFAKTVLNILLGLFAIGIVGIGLWFLKYYNDEGELTGEKIVTITIAIILALVFIRILADVIIRL